MTDFDKEHYVAISDDTSATGIRLVLRCEASSWKGQSHRPYGPGGWNRCVRTGEHEKHKDGFGNIFVFDPQRETYRVIGHEVTRKEELS